MTSLVWVGIKIALSAKYSDQPLDNDEFSIDVPEHCLVPNQGILCSTAALILVEIPEDKEYLFEFRVLQVEAVYISS